MRAVNSAISKLKETLIEITEINKETYDFFNRYVPNEFRLLLDSVLDKNSRADILLDIIIKNENVTTFNKIEWIDNVKHFLTYEFAKTPKVKYEINILTEKLKLLYNQFSQDEVLLKTKSLAQKRNRVYSFFSIEPVSCVVIVAVPVEFRAIYRYLEEMIEVTDLRSLEVALDRKKDKEKELRRDLQAFGIIKNENVFAKIAIINLSEYGSIDSSVALKGYTDLKGFPKEIILVGIAGQMDKKNIVKKGDIVISTGFYDAYPQKLNIEIDYSKKDVIPLENSKPSIIDKKKWQPKEIYEKRPRIKDKKKENKTSNVYMGYFVSGPAVVKEERHKTNIQNTFSDVLAVEMEASGCYKVVNNKSKFRIIKSVCDWSTANKDKRWQSFCADIAAYFTVEYILAKYGKKIS
ncbi:MAG: hypothetical protein M0Q51_11140 [Bacteroidales bacterium]|nr:hypothetical protein [Bacteroidales bacterium]